MRSWLVVLFLLFLFTSCKKVFKYNSSEVRLEENYRNLNSKNISTIVSAPAKESFSFLVISDSQRSYDQLDDFVKKANSFKDISFVVLDGDITDFGLQTEYIWIAERMKKLSFPFIAVIGNHDMLGNGREVYKEMFGAENFSFSYSGFRFIVMNSNFREGSIQDPLPDTTWFKRELSSTPVDEKIFVLSHIAPFSGDFDRTMETCYVKMLNDNANVVYSIHGHEGKYLNVQPYGPPVNYIVVNSINKRTFVRINVNHDAITVEQIFF